MDDSTSPGSALRHKRLSQAAHRALLHGRAVVRPALAPERPVFVIGCPRSGTTLLYLMLRRHPALAGTGSEGHLWWDAHQHPSRKGWSSDRSTSGDIARDERAFLYRAIADVAAGRRFIDKTPKNALRVPYLDALFPDATFVFLRRDPRATVSSLIEGWTAHHGIAYKLPVTLELPTYRGRYWSYLLPPGWREVTRTSVEEIAALQYRSANDIALDDLAGVDPARVIEVGFEDLLASPGPTVGDVLRRLGLEGAPAVDAFVTSLDSHQVSTVSAPRPEKWRERQTQLERVLPALSDTSRRLGYPAEGVTT